MNCEVDFFQSRTAYPIVQMNDVFIKTIRNLLFDDLTYFLNRRVTAPGLDTKA